jgi:hypothetical protein
VKHEAGSSRPEVTSGNQCCGTIPRWAQWPVRKRRPPLRYAALVAGYADALYSANLGDLDSPFTSKVMFLSETEPLVLSSISLPTSNRVTHRSVE